MIKKSKITEHDILSSLLNSTQIKYFWKDKDRKFLGASQSFLDYYGFDSLNEILGKNDEDMGWHIDPEPFKNDEETVISEGTPIYNATGTCIIRGNMRYISATKIPIRGENNEILGLVGFFEDITEQYRMNEELERRASTDSVTGFLNKYGFVNILSEYVKGYEEHKMDFVVYYVDLDNFREANDTYGHIFGDRVLKSVSENILNDIGKDSVIARMDADLFAVVHQFQANRRPAAMNRSVLVTEEKIRNAAESINYVGEHSFRIQISIGYSAYSENLDIDKTLDQAMVNLLEEKRYKRR
ncbi:MAG: diguanylate cyclase [Lachnospiraceae bacterium]|nr:diguanylate cyclase [Lachnospiraceae bacterium]